MLKWLRGHMSLVTIAGALLVGGGVLAAVMVPLFATSGQVTAEVAGSLPSSAIVGHQLEIDISYDNTGTNVISPVCVALEAQGRLTPNTAVFQGIDHEAFSNGAACGGALGAGNTISIRIALTPASSGSVTYQFTPLQGGKAIGPALKGTMVVAPH